MHSLPTALASMGLVLLLSGCATNYEDRCMEQGYKSGSPELADCIEQRQKVARASRWHGSGRPHCPLCRTGQGR